MVLCWNPFRITIQFFQRFFGGIIESAYNGAFGGAVTPSVCSLRSQPPSPRGRLNPLSHGLRRASSPEGGALFVLTGRCKKAPPERTDFPRPGENVTAGDKRGNLAATIGSRLRGLASPWGSWRAAPEGVIESQKNLAAAPRFRRKRCCKCSSPPRPLL